MKTFEKSSKLDNVLYDVRGPVVDEAARMEEDGMEILKLNIGNPYPFGFSFLSQPLHIFCASTFHILKTWIYNRLFQCFF